MLRSRCLAAPGEGRTNSRPSFIEEPPSPRDAASSSDGVDIGVAVDGLRDIELGTATPDCEPTVAMGTTCVDSDDIELGESKPDYELAKVVAKVVEIGEEGIFRNVVRCL